MVCKVFNHATGRYVNATGVNGKKILENLNANKKKDIRVQLTVFASTVRVTFIFDECDNTIQRRTK